MVTSLLGDYYVQYKLSFDKFRSEYRYFTKVIDKGNRVDLLEIPYTRTCQTCVLLNILTWAILGNEQKLKEEIAGK